MNNLNKPSHLVELCKKYGLVPSKKYGQNYLISDSPVQKMINASQVKKGDSVVEIGPGFGVLTSALLERGAKVVAFEIERKLEKYWEDNSHDNLEIIWGDALKRLKSLKLKGYKVAANLPYQITSHILRTLLELENKPESITVMVQKEVADRIVAKPGDMSVLAVSVQYYGEPKVVCKVPSGNFWPEPKVNSAILHVKVEGNKKQGSDFDKKFFEVVRAGFANKRKQLWRNLSVGLKLDKNEVQTVLKQAVGNEKVRAQELGVEEWITLTKKLT